MDIFGDDIDSLLQNNDELNENIHESDADAGDAENPGEENADNDENGEPKNVEPKKRAVRNPQLRLNVERLKSDRGIHTVEKYCADLKFNGKGYEKQDLNNLMKRLEHWAHRLYPNYKFDDFVACVEKLGKKKQMQTHMYRYRQGLLEDTVANKNNEQDGDADAADDPSHFGGDEPIDELDEIIDQQIQNYTIAPKTPAHDRTFDSIRSSIVASPRFLEQNPVEASTPVTKPATGVEKENTTVQVMAAPTVPTLTSEQMAKIAENRRLAQERLKKRQMEAAMQSAIASTSSENNF